MTVQKYAEYKISLLSQQFMLNLNEHDILLLRECTTISSTDVAARQILKQKWETNDYRIS